jgi:hypothetical protein
MDSTRPYQWQADLIIDAPLEAIWNAIEDLSLIPHYHPSVRQVEFSPESARRAPGAEYKCVVPDGLERGWCVEKVIDHVPLQRSTTTFTADSWGLSELIDDFVTEVEVETVDASKTRVIFKASYKPRGWRGEMLNATVLRENMRRRAIATLEGLKRLLEGK